MIFVIGNRLDSSRDVIVDVSGRGVVEWVASPEDFERDSEDTGFSPEFSAKVLQKYTDGDMTQLRGKAKLKVLDAYSNYINEQSGSNLDYRKGEHNFIVYVMRGV